MQTGNISNIKQDIWMWCCNQIHSEPYKKRDILFLTITLANLNGFLQFYIVLIVKKFYMRL